jgi:hypothetical protein
VSDDERSLVDRIFGRGESSGAPGDNGHHANGSITNIWADHASYLADWADRRLINRHDRWGGIRDQAGKPGWYKVTGKLSASRLARHFKGATPTDIIGAYSIAPDPDGVCWSLWLGLDFDHHGNGPAPHATWKAAIACHDTLVGLGFRSILEDSNGRGGFHVWVLFTERVQTMTARMFGLWLIRDWKSWGLTQQPEVFPKQDHITRKDCGNLLRIPGRHFKHPEHWSRIWDGSNWLEGEDAIDRLVNTTGDSPNLIPQEARGFSTKSARTANGSAAPSGDLESLKRQLIALTPQLDDAAVGWKVKHRPEGGDILIGACPFDHDSGTSNPDDLSAGFHEDRPYIKCLHESCKAIPKLNRKLWAAHRAKEKPNEALDDPHRLARLFIRQCKHEGKLTLRLFRGEWFQWTDNAYLPMTESELHSRLGKVIKREFNRLNQLAIANWTENSGIEKPQAQKVTRNLVANVTLALQSMILLEGRANAPFWL